MFELRSEMKWYLPPESDFIVQPSSPLEFPGPLTPPPPWNFQFPPWWRSGYFLEPHIIIYTPYHSWFFLQKSWMVQKGSSNLSVSIIKIRKWCHWPRVLGTSLWGWSFLFFIIFYFSSVAGITGYCSCYLVLCVIQNFWLCESNLLVWPSIIFTSSVSCVILIFFKLHH